MNDYRYRDLGLLRDEDLTSLKGKVTKRRFRTFDAAASLEIFYEASFKIQPDDATKTVVSAVNAHLLIDFRVGRVWAGSGRLWSAVVSSGQLWSADRTDC